MKRNLLGVVMLTLVVFTAKSQVNPHAIGLRFNNGNYGYGSEISYQHGFGSANRLEADLGLGSNNWSGRYRTNYTTLSGIYHWVMNIDGGFNWYIGPGAQLLLYNYNGYGYSYLGIGGQIGLEYDLNDVDIPFVIGLDTRPMLMMYNGGNDMNYGISLSARYTF